MRSRLIRKYKLRRTLASPGGVPPRWWPPWVLHVAWRCSQPGRPHTVGDGVSRPLGPLQALGTAGVAHPPLPGGQQDPPRDGQGSPRSLSRGIGRSRPGGAVSPGRSAPSDMEPPPSRRCRGVHQALGGLGDTRSRNCRMPTAPPGSAPVRWHSRPGPVTSGSRPLSGPRDPLRRAPYPLGGPASSGSRNTEGSQLHRAPDRGRAPVHSRGSLLLDSRPSRNHPSRCHS